MVDQLQKNTGNYRGLIILYNIVWKKLRKAKPLHYQQQVEGEVDWLDAVPVEIPPQSAQDNDYNISVVSTRHETNYSDIPQLESAPNEEEEGQFDDIQTYLDHHNTYQESQNI